MQMTKLKISLLHNSVLLEEHLQHHFTNIYIFNETKHHSRDTDL